MNTSSSSSSRDSPDARERSSPDSDSSGGGAQAESPSWAHVVRKGASGASTSGAFNRPRAIGGSQASAPDREAQGGSAEPLGGKGASPGQVFQIRKGASPGQEFQIRTEGTGISFGSGRTEDMEGQTTIPLPRTVGTPMSAGERDSTGSSSSSESEASSGHSREEHQRQKRQRKKAQRVLAGQEETRSRRKRTLKKQRRQPGADLHGAADVPMELQQLYRAEGVGLAAADLKELSQIWLTKEPPCTPRERAVEMRVQERAFAERWRVEKRIRVRRWERGPGHVLTEAERPQEMADDAWLAEHGMQRHELSQVDRMA
jgi:hypothetical protein